MTLSEVGGVGTIYVMKFAGPDLVVIPLSITGMTTHDNNSPHILALQTVPSIYVHSLGLYCCKNTRALTNIAILFHNLVLACARSFPFNAYSILSRIPGWLGALRRNSGSRL